MEKSESIKNIAAAILKVMAEVKGIEKNMEIGSGNSKYNGVADQEVKKIIGESMQKNGLSIIPFDITESTQLNEWDETYNGIAKRKQSIFAKVTVKYMLLHESGEFLEVVGYGHGVDSQDKAAGKATTYALKYALLYMFLVPTGKIDDADNTHSDNIPVPQNKIEPKPQKPGISDSRFKRAIDRALSGEPDIYKNLMDNFTLTTAQVTEFQTAMMAKH